MMNEALRCSTLAPYIQDTTVCRNWRPYHSCQREEEIHNNLSFTGVYSSRGNSTQQRSQPRWRRVRVFLDTFYTSKQFLVLFRFDHERFSEANVKSRPSLAFEQLGFGKRKCLGYNFATVEFSILVPILLRSVV